MRPAGILVVDKPGGLTSRAAAELAASLAGADKSGHTGTLDPLATGVLVVCLGRATLLARFLSGGAKVYRTVALLGVRTDTYDVEGTVLATSDSTSVAAEDIIRQAAGLTGRLAQQPPPYSAVKHMGRPLHSYARAGVEVPSRPRIVSVESIRLESFAREADGARATLLIECGPGTYVRSLVRDLGEALGCGACVERLRRLRSGRFSLDQAVGLERLRSAESAGRFILSMEDATDDMETVRLGPESASAVAMGKPLRREMAPGAGRIAVPTRVLDGHGNLVAVLGPPRRDDPEEIIGRALRVIRPVGGNGRDDTSQAH